MSEAIKTYRCQGTEILSDGSWGHTVKFTITAYNDSRALTFAQDWLIYYSEGICDMHLDSVVSDPTATL